MKGLTQISPYWGEGGATLRSLSLLLLFIHCNLRCSFSQSSYESVWTQISDSAPVLGSAGQGQQELERWAGLGWRRRARAAGSERPEEPAEGWVCSASLRQVHKHFPLLGATCSLLDVYYKSMQFHKAPACNKTLLLVWGLKEINGSSLGMHILLRCLLQMKWSWGKTLTSCRVIKGILSFLSDINRKKPLTKSIKFLFPNEFALTIY